MRVLFCTPAEEIIRGYMCLTLPLFGRCIGRRKDAEEKSERMRDHACGRKRADGLADSLELYRESAYRCA